MNLLSPTALNTSAIACRHQVALGNADDIENNKDISGSLVKAILQLSTPETESELSGRKGQKSQSIMTTAPIDSSEN